MKKRGLKFYPGNHSYFLDGERVPGVTTIIGVLDKPGLRKWAASSVAEYVADHRDAVEHLYAAGRGPMVAALKETPWQQAKDAAARGTNLHDYAEQIVNGEEVDVPEVLVPVVENALGFMEEFAIEPLLVEGCVGSREHRYAGKGDLWADSKVGRAYFDWKSGKRIYPSTALQAVGYCFAEFTGENGDESPLPEVEAAYGVHIRADGFDVIPLRFGRDVFQEFLTIREAFEINKRCEGDWRVVGSGYAGAALQLSGGSDAEAV